MIRPEWLGSPRKKTGIRWLNCFSTSFSNRSLEYIFYRFTGLDRVYPPFDTRVQQFLENNPKRSGIPNFTRLYSGLYDRRLPSLAPVGDPFFGDVLILVWRCRSSSDSEVWVAAVFDFGAACREGVCVGSLRAGFGVAGGDCAWPVEVRELGRKALGLLTGLRCGPFAGPPRLPRLRSPPRCWCCCLPKVCCCCPCA